MENTLMGMVLEHLKNKNMEALKILLAQADNMEILDALHDLSPEESVLVFRLLAKDDALNVFEHLDTTLQQKLLKSFTDEKALEIMDEMPPDARVRLLEELPATVAKRLINALSAQERAVTNILMGYQPETAGRIMTTEYISLRRNMTVTEAMQKIRNQAMDKETIYTLYVTDNKKKLEGVLTLKNLIIAEPDAKIEAVMSETVIKVSTDTDQEKVANTLQELDLLAIPVVDKENRLVGIVTIDDAIDILEEEATEDIYDQAGLADLTSKETNRSEVLVNGSLWAIWKVRLPFLVFTMLAGLLSGLVIDEFEEALERVTAVAVFIPVIMHMGGNVGTQSSTVFVRGVLLGHIHLKNFFRHFIKEVGIGLSIGALIGATTGVIALLWQGNPMLGLAVGLSLGLTMTVAALLGFFVPYLLIKFNVDQAAGSAPIITSIKDIVGLVIYFVLVTSLMGTML